jgi:hypothetical protein
MKNKNKIKLFVVQKIKKNIERRKIMVQGLVSINVQDAEALKTWGVILLIYSGFLVVFSIVGISTKSLTVGRFLLLFLSFVPISFTGAIFYKKNEYISARSVIDTRWNRLYYAVPAILILSLILLIESVFGCGDCFAVIAIVFIAYVLIMLVAALVYHLSNKKPRTSPAPPSGKQDAESIDDSVLRIDDDNSIPMDDETFQRKMNIEIEEE